MWTFALTQPFSLCLHTFARDQLDFSFDPWIFCLLLANFCASSDTGYRDQNIKHMGCHVPHASRIATYETIFMETLFIVSNEIIQMVMVARFLSNKWWSISEKALGSPFLRHRGEGKREQEKQEWQLQNFFRMHTQKYKLPN